MPTESVATPTAATTPLPTGTWKVDPVHSSVEFQVKHLGIATVKGQFTEFEGSLEIDADGARASGTVRGGERRHARGPARRAPALGRLLRGGEPSAHRAFASTAIRPLEEDEFEIDADLTIHGVTRPVTLKAVFEGAETDPQGNERVGVSASTQINRSRFGMKFNAALGSGNVVVSDRVKILVEVSAVKQ